MHKPTILIVEDADLLLELAICAFREAGYETIAAANGAEALAVLGGPQRIDLLLTDIRLPGDIDGWDIAERARARSPDLPVIYVTGYSSQEPRPVPGSLLFLKPCRSGRLLDAAHALGVGRGWAGIGD